ncbi:Inner membrane protein YbjJ [Nocardioides dokdonensis FR1436]|uniref:Inner membrane protein YbjJ n=1 Tax=Nocardioides dokdonensis FR1436 TaxID=1300347 RepID=A0A1A9GPU4_9ACTN|nr:MFS transporter [Nocardioides dokdonensis]ANH40319.1 Inner membrane protein YbjJ [Nocardioides dokdonensis FR1436]
MTGRSRDALQDARHAVAWTFVLNGLVFASLVARLPDLRERLALSNTALGLLLLAVAVGSMLALPTTGHVIARAGAARTVRLGAGLDTCGLGVAAAGATLGSLPLTTLGLFVHGAGTGVWDVAMNVEAAEVERRLARTIMPRFHAGWSLGSIIGAGVGVAVLAAGVPLLAHLLVVSGLALVLAWRSGARYLPTRRPVDGAGSGEDGPVRRASPWTEPRTLAIGVMVMAFAMVEGTANDWLSLALIDGYGVQHWVGVAGFGLFVVAMTTGRLVGPVLLDRWGRAPVLWASTALAGAGVLLTVLGASLPLVAVGILVWGLGASLGFPVGMSAAADDPEGAALRVSVVATIGYGAFLAGPPLLGRLADRVGTLEVLLVVAVLMVPAAAGVSATRRAPTARRPAHGSCSGPG